MADGSSYSIDVAVNSVGAETSADELNRLAAGLDAAGATSTKFDNAIQRTTTLLAQASSASQEAAAAVAAGAAKYAQLERSAEIAAKAVERASMAGKDTSALQAKAADAAAALRLQGTALDELKAKATAAASAEEKLKNSLGTLRSAAKEAAAATKKGGASLEETTALAKGALGPMGGIYERASMVAKGLSNGGLAGAAVLAAVALAAMTGAIVVGIGKLAVMAVTLNKVAMDRLNKATERAKENFSKLFSGVRVDQFVAGVEKVLGIFDETSSTAKGLKAVISALLNPLFDQSGSLAPIVIALFRGMTLGALETAIAVVKLSKALDALMPESLQGQVDWLETAFVAGKWAVYGMAAVLVALAAAGAIVAGVLAWVAITIAATTAALVLLAVVGLALVLWPFILVGIAIAAAIVWFDEIKAAVLDFGAAAVSAAGSLIDGLVNGITSGAGAVYDAIKGLAAGAIGTLKSALGIHSPSTVFALAGSYTAEGFAEGVEGNDAPQSAVSSMVEPPDMQKARANGKAASGRGGSRADLSGATFNFYGVKDAEHARGMFEQALTSILEGDVIQLGGGEVPAT